MSRC
ncbi:hypothetical protein LINPERPRIM_LOCUS25388 [Linum perenne]